MNLLVKKSILSDISSRITHLEHNLKNGVQTDKPLLDELKRLKEKIEIGVYDAKIW